MWVSTNGYRAQLREKFRALSFFSKILAGVFAVHLLGIVCLSINHIFHKEPPKKKIMVRTFKKAPPLSPQVVVKAPPPKKQVAVKLKPKPKKAPAPVPLVKKAPPPVPVVKKAPAPTPVPVPVIKKVENPQVVVQEQPKVQEEKVLAEYGEALIVFFQNSLDLPEYGEVTLDLEIDATGHVTRVEVIEAKSKENEEFLKKELPELVCPCFNGDQTSRNSFAFTVVFKNR